MKLYWKPLLAFTCVWLFACPGTREVEAPLPSARPLTCVQTIALDSAESDHTTVGPQWIDEDGLTLCLRLDARHTRRSALMAYTANESQTHPSFTIDLFYNDGRPLVSGWEVPMAGPTSSAHLEWSTEVPAIYDFVLHVAALPQQARTTLIIVSFFDPLE